MQAMQELAVTVNRTSAANALGMSRATEYRLRQTRPRPPVRRRTPAWTLSPEEVHAILTLLHSERFVDLAPAEIVAILQDEGTYLCSERTMYRLLAQAGEVRERRAQARRTAYQAPELLATGPNQVWSWDITKLRGPGKWNFFCLYVVLDIYSRMVTAWTVATRESADLACNLIAQACTDQGVSPGQLTIHADRGSAMTSKSVSDLLIDLDVHRSHSRPHVSNDNPYSEAQFKTLKYQPAFPDRFGSEQDARAFCRGFMAWYNDEHRHSGLCMLTPANVHYGQAQEILQRRHEVMLAAYAAHPERFSRPPRRHKPPAAAWINRPLEPAGHDGGRPRGTPAVPSRSAGVPGGAPPPAGVGGSAPEAAD